jgi:ketosteroid isomerase-like protein
MSQADVEVMRRFTGPYEGEDALPAIRESLERFGPDPQPEVVLARWAEDPGWQHVHPEIEWDTSATGAFGSVARGPTEVARWWREWTETWETYVYRTVSFRDLGEWVLSPANVQARSRDGISVEMMVFQVWQVRDGKVALMRGFLSENDALEAVGLSG